MSASILPYLREASFDADAIRLMGDAFDIARRDMHDNGQPDMVLEIIAKRVIEITRSGERDPRHIAKLALAAIGLQSGA
jgi:hypothetical protein